MKIVLFPDDTNLLFAGDTLEQLKDVTKEITKVKIWFDCNKLSKREQHQNNIV